MKTSINFALAADRLLQRFGLNDISLDEFDGFIVDYDYAPDPGPHPDEFEEMGDEEGAALARQKYSGFVSARAAIRKGIDTAAQRREDSPYRLRVKQANLVYELTGMVEGQAREQQRSVNALETFTENKQKYMEQLANQSMKYLATAKELHAAGLIDAEYLTKATISAKVARKNLKQLNRGINDFAGFIEKMNNNNMLLEAAIFEVKTATEEADK